VSEKLYILHAASAGVGTSVQKTEGPAGRELRSKRLLFSKCGPGWFGVAWRNSQADVALDGEAYWTLAREGVGRLERGGGVVSWGVGCTGIFG